MDIYSLPAVVNARQRAASARRGAKATLQAGLGEVKTAGIIAGSSYGTARLSAHLGGPGGAKIGGVDLPLAVGGACALLAMSGMAGEYTDEVLAVGIGAVSGLAAQKGFDAGMKSHKPQEGVAGYPAHHGYPQVGAGYAGYDALSTGFGHVGAPLSAEDIVEQFAQTPSPEPEAA